jgi:hypothetical protein
VSGFQNKGNIPFYVDVKLSKSSLKKWAGQFDTISAMSTRMSEGDSGFTGNVE